jgi:hypothetical protein
MCAASFGETSRLCHRRGCRAGLQSSLEPAGSSLVLGGVVVSSKRHRTRSCAFEPRRCGATTTRRGCASSGPAARTGSGRRRTHRNSTRGTQLEARIPGWRLVRGTRRIVTAGGRARDPAAGSLMLPGLYGVAPRLDPDRMISINRAATRMIPKIAAPLKRRTVPKTSASTTVTKV